jgi:dTDP-4-dehydrorhamnose reductase
VATPTYLPDLTVALVRLMQEPVYGVYHLTNAGQCSRYEWARLTLGLAGLGGVDVVPAVMADFPAAVPKPAYSALRNFCGADLGITLRPWQEALEDYFRHGRAGS